MTAPTATVSTYRVTLNHARLSGPLVFDLIATNMDAAVTRGRFTAMHMYREAELLKAGSTAIRLHPGTCRDAGHERGECGPS